MSRADKTLDYYVVLALRVNLGQDMSSGESA
jgi:hypothetical protein